MDKQEAIKRLDALDAEAQALRAIIEAGPKKEPRGLCWVDDNSPLPGHNRVTRIVKTREDGWFETPLGTPWRYAIPLTEDEMRTYRGRWE